jgi:glycosyltransferase involved in cell wall biosynthesis
MSKNEGLPISIIEAMRASMMVISTNISGIPELVREGYNGFLMNPDTDELVECLMNLPETDIEVMGKNSRVRFENEFTFARMEREFCDMYDNFNRKQR